MRENENMLGISIENMTRASCLLYIVSGAFGVLAVVLFFLLDIMKCWKMVSRKVFHSFPAEPISKPGVHSKKRKTFKNVPLQETALLSNQYGAETDSLCNENKRISERIQETILLRDEYGLEGAAPQETVLLSNENEPESVSPQETILLNRREYGNLTKL